MLYIALALVLLGFELVYFRLANRLNIIDKPNERSSHTRITLRGGGIIYPIGILLYFFAFRFQYPWFVAGLMAIAAISLADDIQHVHSGIRILVHILAVGLLLHQAGLFAWEWYWWLVSFVLVIGVINAYNFMDGINGITALYGFTIVGAHIWLNQRIELLDPNLLYVFAIANGVFAWFNARRKARCFAGDVGSVSVAFTLLFFTVKVILHTGNPIFILFFALYGIDTVLTIIQRLYQRENIFEAHRQHLFQYLANEEGWPHLRVTALYTFLQAIVSAGVLWAWQQAPSIQWIFALIVLGILTSIYLIVKMRIYRSRIAPVSTGAHNMLNTD